MREVQRLLLLWMAAMERKRLWMKVVFAGEMEVTALLWLGPRLVARFDYDEGRREGPVQGRAEKKARDLLHHRYQ